MENESKEVNAELKQEISDLKELYVKELERQSEERKTQSEIAEQDKINDVETEKIEKEEAVKNKAEQEERFNQVLETLGSIDDKLSTNSNEESEQESLINEMKTINDNLSSIIAYQENSHQYELNNQSLTTMGVAVLIVGFGVFALYKFGGFIVSKIINMIN